MRNVFRTRLPWSSADASPPAAHPRPCLPSIEKLDSRLLLSVSVSDIHIVKQVDKSTPILMEAESAALTPVPGTSLDGQHKAEFVQLGIDFYKVNDILLKYEQDILNQKLTPTEGDDVALKLNEAFLKIESVASDLDGGTGQLLPAVQQVFDLAVGNADQVGNFGPSVLSDLSALAGQLKLSPLPDGEADALSKMAGDFYKLAEVAVDYKLDIIQGVPTEVAQKQATHKEQMEYLKLTLDQVLVSSYVSEADQTDLKYLINNALDLVNGVINPGTPTVGTTLPADTGDTIA